MKNMSKIIFTFCALFFIGAETILAYKYTGDSGSGKTAPAPPSVMAGCTPSSARKDLDINNVRAMILSGGDMWWDLSAAKYEVPKTPDRSGSSALFAGALWLGGKDVSGQLKVAAQRFRQVGIDYWTGPLSTVTAEIEPATCVKYDRHFVTTRQEVAEFSGWFQTGLEDAANGTSTQADNFPNYQIPQSILDWPAHGRNYAPYNEDLYLAPFFDNNGDGVYNPLDGDYPAYDLLGKDECSTGKIDKIYGDQNLWWVFNDKGNIHTETGSASIGMEIRAQAFAFATSDEVNNMTFYNYELVNRSTFTLAETYFGQWVDADLGCAQDDYVGCDVQRGLGYCYNGDELDQDCAGSKGYGSQPPAIGVDFFQGPYQDNDDADNPLLNVSNPTKIKQIQFRPNTVSGDSIYVSTFTPHQLFANDTADISIVGSLIDSSTDPDSIYNIYIRQYKNVIVKVISTTEFTIKARTSAPFSIPATLPGDTGTYTNPGNDNLFLNLVGYDQIVDESGIPYKGIGIGYGDGVKDNERFGMRKFLYHNNDNSVRGDPQIGSEYYSYLRSFWRDGSRMVYGGTGHSSDPNANKNVLADYMFPDDTDPIGWGTDGQPQSPWSEVTAGNTPGDRRFMQSAGPFTLTPGATNNITVGVVWARATSGGAWASVQSMRKADDKTQAMFDNCFKIIDGPDAPDISFREMDRELIMYISNKNSNNENEEYAANDLFLVPPDKVDTDNDGVPDYTLTEKEKSEFSEYRFQGYLIYQIKDHSVSTADLKNPEKARLIAQCDIKDGIDKIVNNNFDSEINADVPVLEVVGEDKGIFHSLRITEDKFATGDKRLVNHKKVYFMVIAYAYNYSKFNQYLPLSDRQKKPFLPSRKAATGGIKQYPAIPHKNQMENTGTIANSKYGDGVELTRIEGQGNGGIFLVMKQESRDSIVSAGRILNPVYEAGLGPVAVKVVDPLNVPAYDFILQFRDSAINTPGDLSDAYWWVYPKGKSTEVVNADQSITVENEQVILKWGISVTIKHVPHPRTSYQSTEYDNDFIGTTMLFSDDNKQWLTGVRDADGESPMNWIRSGTAATPPDHTGVDDDQVYETVLNGTWAPFRLCASDIDAIHGPVPNVSGINYLQVLDSIKYLQSVDIIFTSDKSKWTRCPVLEMQTTPSLLPIMPGNPNYFGVLYGPDYTVNPPTTIQPTNTKGYIKNSPSLNKDGVKYDTTGFALKGWTVDSMPVSTNPNDPNYISGIGMSWFPGYAICVETGERLNMAFGEDSWLGAENGRDMLWNPTSNITEGPFEDVRMGGKHYIYIFRNNVVEEQLPLTSQNPDSISPTNPKFRMPAYDAGKFLFANLSKISNIMHHVNPKRNREARAVYRSAMWVGLPLLNAGHTLLSSDAMVSIRVNKPYEAYGTGTYVSKGEPLIANKFYTVDKGDVIHNNKTYKRGQYFYSGNITSFSIAANDDSWGDTINNLVTTVNWGLPMYTFSTRDLAAKKDSSELMVDALKLINVVPNPYYAYSEYETDKIDNRIKIINLPRKCTITIYTTNGTLVRKYTKDDPTITSLDWDLKNHARIPIASGLYIIHVEVPEVGERTLKWMGIMRPIDLDSF